MASKPEWRVASRRGIGIQFLLACSACLLVLCFTFIDVSAFYSISSTSKELQVVILQSLRGNLVTNSPMSGSPSEIIAVDQTDDDEEDSFESVKKKSSPVKSALSGCDISHGRWVYDETYPLYRYQKCLFADRGFNCERNGRPDTDFMKFRWQPHDCDLPRFDPEDMLERLRDQRLVFIGDSLGRNQWDSMLCMLAQGVQNKSRIYQTNGQAISKNSQTLVVRFQDYNCTVEYYRDPFLVPRTQPPPNSPSDVKSAVKIDQVSWSAGRWPGANILVFNTGHWWSRERIGGEGGRFQMGNNLTTHGVEDAFQIALKTWALWMEDNLDPANTQVFFRSYAPRHFRGGSWNTGGHCDQEVKPLTDLEGQEWLETPWTNKHIVDAINQNIKTKRGAVEFMNITASTNYRSDGHPGLYSHLNKGQDCSHFCLPGVPDTWNEVLFATLLARGQGVWGVQPQVHPGKQCTET